MYLYVQLTKEAILQSKTDENGRVNLETELTTIDAALSNFWARGASNLEAYALVCADVSGNDGKVTVIDVALINSNATGASALWG